jgi:hypothetical protein
MIMFTVKMLAPYGSVKYLQLTTKVGAAKAPVKAAK